MKSSVMLGVWMLAATLLVAQPRSRNAQHHEGQAEKMKTELSLSDTQYASIKTITKKYSDKQHGLRRDSTLAREEKQIKQKTLKAEKKKEIDAVLTAEQKTKWRAYKSKQAEVRKARMKEKQARHAARLKDTLGLSDEQQVKMDAAGATFKEKAQRLRDNATSKEDKRAEMKKLRADHEAAVKGILRDDQFKKWQELKAKSRKKHKERRR